MKSRFSESISRFTRMIFILGPVNFKRVVKAAFSLRRKMLSNSLKTLGLEPEIVAEALKGAGIDAKRRAETLSLQEFSSLALSFEKTCTGICKRSSAGSVVCPTTRPGIRYSWTVSRPWKRSTTTSRTC